MDHMKKALASRRGKGLDITIILGNDQDEKQKTSDLAPPPAHGSLDPDLPKHDGQMEEMNPMDPAHHQDPEMDAAMMGQMTDVDKTDMMSRKPRSLGERARQAFMMKDKK